MTVIHAADRFRPSIPADVREFIHHMQWDPVIEFRKCGPIPLSRCGRRGSLIAEVIIAAIARIDAAHFITGFYWDDKHDTEGAIYFDAAAAKEHGIEYSLGERVGMEVGDAWIELEVWPRRASGEGA